MRDCIEFFLHFERNVIVNFSIVNTVELEDARRHPEKHRDLVVRVWGYNAYFVDLDDELQLHIINRTIENA